MAMITDNPLADFHSYDASCEDWLERRPLCVCCKEHIQDDGAYETDSGLICADCLHDKMYRWKMDNYKVIED